MKRLLIYAVIASAVLCITFSACSKSENEQPEKGKIEQMTEKAGKEAAEGIQQPINKARDIQEKAEKRVKELDESAKQ